MWIYIFTICISCFLIWIAEKLNNNIKGFLLTLAVIIPSVISGVRADTVGTDVRSYVKPIWYLANSSDNLFSFINNQGSLISGDEVSRFEKGYMLFTYMCTKINSSFFFNLFFSEFLIIGLTLLGLWRFKKNHNISVTLGMFVFYTMLYNPSLNIVRQSIAMAILAFAFNFLIEKKVFKYILLVIIATLFHQTALIGIFMLLVYYCTLTQETISIKINSERNVHIAKATVRVWVIVLAMIIVVLLPNILNTVLSLFNLNRFQWAYLFTLNSWSINQFFIRVPFILLIAFQWPALKNNQLRYMYLIILLMDVLTSQFSGGSGALLRLSLYFSNYYVFVLPDEVLSSDKNKSAVITILLIIYLVVYWYYMFVFNNYNNTVPYIFGGFN